MPPRRRAPHGCRYEVETMKNIMFAIAATLLGTLAYIMIGVALASAS
jgi:hypothetical protein